MSKKPVPKKKQAVSSTRARAATWARKSRKKLENASQITKCKKCGSDRRSHFACEECGFYGENQVFSPRVKSQQTPVQEIEA